MKIFFFIGWGLRGVKICFGDKRHLLRKEALFGWRVFEGLGVFGGWVVAR